MYTVTLVEDVEDVLLAASPALLRRRQRRLELDELVEFLLGGLEGLLDLDGNIEDVDLGLRLLRLLWVVALGADVNEGSLRAKENKRRIHSWIQRNLSRCGDQY